MGGEFRFIAALDLNVKPEKPKPKLEVVRSRQ
jgi:hypothetical protein